MIGHICISGKKCIFYQEKIEPYEIIMNFGKGDIRKKGTEINYYCTNPKKLKYYETRKAITKPIKKCRLKTTNQLGEFIGIKG